MTYSSIANALVQLFETNPSVTSVKRGDQFKLGLKGSLIPTPDLTPYVQISRSSFIRGVRPSREEIQTQEGIRFRWLPHQIEVWEYVNDPVTDVDAFQDLVDDLEQLVRRHPRLDGAADTVLSSVVLVQVKGDQPSPRPLGVHNGRSLMHSSFVVEVEEAVNL